MIRSTLPPLISDTLVTGLAQSGLDQDEAIGMIIFLHVLNPRAFPKLTKIEIGLKKTLNCLHCGLL